ncbi:DUF2971 domain-containing protein [Prevotella dentasini]|uniref:DUF2971 domain-containing protein n=1 Tax=Prevotella dentasini TaxID=589537 RepID=UPI00046806B0|nr:DUF2971 domain-containing protein [Prevotella dentasini]
MLLTKLPAYLYGQEEFPHKSDGALFHYTSLYSFKKIMEDLTLKPSSFARLNDMNEGNVNNMCMDNNIMVMVTTERYINEKCHIISFSQNYDIQGYEFEGSNHPAMWTHYADNSNGVCIVIDKEAFIANNKDILSRHFYKFEDVEYSLFNTPDDKDINYEAETPEEFIRNNWKKLFFLKHKDWANEDEHRLFIMDYNGKFSIDGCIKYVVLGRKIFLDDTRIREILDIIVNPKSVCYHKFVPYSFATTCYNTDGYDTFGIAFKIYETIRKYNSNPLYADYEKWLIKEQSK